MPSLWVDGAGTPWRRSTATRRYEKLTTSGWAVSLPAGPLRRVEMAIVRPEGEIVVQTTMGDSLVYFVQGPPGASGGSISWEDIDGKPALVTGVVDGVATDIELWEGTQAALDALDHKDPHTVYVVVG